jgi:hypothetical protein
MWASLPWSLGSLDRLDLHERVRRLARRLGDLGERVRRVSHSVAFRIEGARRIWTLVRLVSLR